MTVIIKNKNGIRYGTYTIYGIQGTFPNQAITSTNLNHVKAAKKTNFDFKTNILEIIEFTPNKLKTEPDYRARKVNAISKIIKANPDKLCLLTLKGARGGFKLTKETNEFLIKFQIDCGFSLIRAFFRYVKNATENAKYYRSLIPQGRSYTAVLDENMTHSVFRKLYLNCLKHDDELISFAGRVPSGKKSKNIKNKLNFQFIARRKTDKIIRMTSFASKSINGVASSYVYHLFGFDVYSFMTRQGNQNIPKFELKSLDKFKFVPLTNTTKLRCVLTGMNLYASSKHFEKTLEKSSLPISVHVILELNKLLEDLQEKYSREELETIIGNSFYLLD